MPSSGMWHHECVNRRFGGMCHFHLHGRKICHLLMLVPCSQIFLPWKWGWYIPPKCWFTQDLNGATSQKAFFIVIVVKTSNPNIQLSACQYFSSRTIKMKPYIYFSEWTKNTAFWGQNQLERRYALMTGYWNKLILLTLYKTFSYYTLCW
jgi:hypothetical protein